jgi:hypothetical protein
MTEPDDLTDADYERLADLAEAGLSVTIHQRVGVMLSVRVPREVALALEDYGVARGLSVTEVVRIALDQLLDGS